MACAAFLARGGLPLRIPTRIAHRAVAATRRAGDSGQIGTATGRFAGWAGAGALVGRPLDGSDRPGRVAVSSGRACAGARSIFAGTICAGTFKREPISASITFLATRRPLHARRITILARRASSAVPLAFRACALRVSSFGAVPAANLAPVVLVLAGRTRRAPAISRSPRRHTLVVAWLAHGVELTASAPAPLLRPRVAAGPNAGPVVWVPGRGGALLILIAGGSVGSLVVPWVIPQRVACGGRHERAGCTR